MRPPLDGIKIVEMTFYQNGPWGTVMLSDMGAEVIKIEDPVKGDPGRGVSTSSRPHPVNAYFETMNRNKRAMTLALNTEEGREVFYTMAKKADVIVQNFRVGVVEKLGVDYETVKGYNPDIVYASVSGLGPKGPDARDPILDPLGQSRGGFAYHSSFPGDEVVPKGGGAIADQTGAIILAQGVLLGVLARERYGVGQHVQVSQLGGQIILQALAINTYLMNGSASQTAPRAGRSNPLMNTYKCSDGRWVSLAATQGDRFWPSLCKALDAEYIQDDPRYCDAASRAANAHELTEFLDRTFSERPLEEWLKVLRAHGQFCEPVQSYAELVEDPQVIENEYLAELQHPTFGTLKQVGVPIKLSETPGGPRSVAPQYGEHTEEVLLEHGYGWDDIERFRQKGVI